MLAWTRAVNVGHIAIDHDNYTLVLIISLKLLFILWPLRSAPPDMERRILRWVRFQYTEEVAARQVLSLEGAEGGQMKVVWKILMCEKAGARKNGGNKG